MNERDDGLEAFLSKVEELQETLQYKETPLEEALISALAKAKTDKEIGNNYFNMGNFEMAERSYSEAIQGVRRMKEDQELRNYVKKSQVGDGNKKKTMLLVDDLMKELSVLLFALLGNRTQTRLNLKKYDDALVDAQSCLEMDEKSTKSWLRLAKAKSGGEDKKESDYNEAIQLLEVGMSKLETTKEKNILLSLKRELRLKSDRFDPSYIKAEELIESKNYEGLVVMIENNKLKPEFIDRLNLWKIVLNNHNIEYIVRVFHNHTQQFADFIYDMEDVFPRFCSDLIKLYVNKGPLEEKSLNLLATISKKENMLPIFACVATKPLFHVIISKKQSNEKKDEEEIYLLFGILCNLSQCNVPTLFDGWESELINGLIPFLSSNDRCRLFVSRILRYPNVIKLITASSSSIAYEIVKPFLDVLKLSSSTESDQETSVRAIALISMKGCVSIQIAETMVNILRDFNLRNNSSNSRSFTPTSTLSTNASLCLSHCFNDGSNTQIFDYFLPKQSSSSSTIDIVTILVSTMRFDTKARRNAAITLARLSQRKEFLSQIKQMGATETMIELSNSLLTKQ